MMLYATNCAAFDHYVNCLGYKFQQNLKAFNTPIQEVQALYITILKRFKYFICFLCTIWISFDMIINVTHAHYLVRFH